MACANGVCVSDVMSRNVKTASRAFAEARESVQFLSYARCFIRLHSFNAYNACFQDLE